MFVMTMTLLLPILIMFTSYLAIVVVIFRSTSNLIIQFRYVHLYYGFVVDLLIVDEFTIIR